MHCFVSSGMAIAIICTLCSWTLARMPPKLPTVRRIPEMRKSTLKSSQASFSTQRDLKFDASLGTHPLNVECHVGTLCTLQNVGLFKLDKTLIPSWLIVKNASTSTFHGIPTGHDVGTHILPEIGLVVQVSYSARELASACRSHRTSPTVAVISIDTDLPSMPPSDRIALFSRLVNLLHSGSPNINLNSIYYLSRAQHQPESLKSLFMLATGPGNTHTMKSNGSLLAWRVGCGSVAPSQLASLQRLEKTAVTGELARIVGFPVRQWFVADDKRLLMEARRLRRSRMRRSPTVDQFGPGAAYVSSEGSGNAYDYEPTGEYGSGFYNGYDSSTNQAAAVPKPAEGVHPVKEDTLPTVHKPLPFYIVKQNMRGQEFKIPIYTFLDKEDGNTNHLKLQLLTRGVEEIDVNDMQNRWLKFDSSSLQLTVIDPSRVAPGNHSFTLRAFDSNDNQVSQILVIRVLGEGDSALGNIRFEIPPGEYFDRYLSTASRKLIAHNIDDEFELLSFQLRQVNTRAYPWAMFDERSLKFYGFPTLDLMDQKISFKLFVRMKFATQRVSPSGYFNVEITILTRRQSGLTHTIAMNVTNKAFTADQFIRNPWLQVQFIENLQKTFARDRVTSNRTKKLFLIQNVTKAFKDDYYYYYSRYRIRRQTNYERDYMISIEWAHRSAFVTNGRCNVGALRMIMNHLFEKRNGQVTWSQNTRIKMRPFYLHGFRVRAIGVCEQDASRIVPNVDSNWLGSPIIIDTPTRPPEKAPENVKMMPITVSVGSMFKKPLMTADARDLNLLGISLKFIEGTQPKWLSICGNQLCGLPRQRDRGLKEFTIEAVDADNVRTATYDIQVNVVIASDANKVNHRVTMNVLPMDGNFEQWFQFEKRRDFLSALEKYLDPNCHAGYGKSCGPGITFLRMVEKKNVELTENPNGKDTKRWPRMLEVDWAIHNLYMNNGCPRTQIEQLREQLYTRNEFSTMIHLEESMRDIGLKTVAISLGFTGDCLEGGGRDPFTQATAPVKGEEGSLSTWKILLIVGTILILITLPVGGVALFCMRSSRRKKKEGAEAATAAAGAARAPEKPSSSRMMEREPLNKQPTNRAGMFDEMDDAPSAPTKPLILPHEKPPVPPPDFGVIDLNSRPSPAPQPSRTTSTTMPRRPLNPYRNMPPNFDRHV